MDIGMINDLIGKEVMKWEWRDSLDSWLDSINGQVYIAASYEFSPANNIQDAWIVVEKLQKHWNVNIGTANPYSKKEGKARESDRFYCEVYGEKTYLEYSHTAPLAICKTALKTVGIEIS